MPGSDGRIDDAEAGRARSPSRIGFPVMIKAAAGGGGRGIRIAHDLEEFERLMPQASAEAQAAFGDGGLYLEKVIERARHIEVQVLGDGKRVIHCFERECSLQRRRQKVWEEAPSPVLPDDVRETALRLRRGAGAKRSNYRGAGTLEYLYDDETHEFYFIEMNTRIQVEHPVTELITGIDLVREMIRDRRRRAACASRRRICACRAMRSRCRINAEDPARNFMPAPGTVDGSAGAGRPGRALRYHALCRLHDAALLRFAARQADRLGRDAGRARIARLKRALGELRSSAASRPRSRCIRRWPSDADVRAGAVRHALARTLARSRMAAPGELRHEGGGASMKTRYSFGGDEHIFVEVDEEMSLEAFFKSLSMTNAVREAKIKGVTEICPANASFQIKFDPDVIKPDDMLAELKKLETGAPTRPSSVIEDAHHRDPGLLQRSLDARDADALPRAPPGSEEHRHRICRAHQQPRRRRRLRQGAFRLALVRLHGRLRRRPAVPLSDGRAQAADRGAEISAAAHRHAEADRRPWRLLRLHLFGARRRRLPDVRHHADADLRSASRRSAICATSWCFFRPGDIVKWKPIDRAAYDHDGRRRRRRASSHRACGTSPSRSTSSRRTSTATTASWRGCSMAIKVIEARPCHHGPGPRPARLLPSRHPALRRHGPLCACAPPICWSATTKAPPVLEAVFMGPELEFTDDATGRRHRRRAAAQGRRRRRARPGRRSR